MTEAERTNKLKEIKDEILDLVGSPLYAERVKNGVFPVIGEGDHFAKIMFIGEAPGKNEAATGRPFCGASGKILDELLASVGIARTAVYVTNVVKDRPPMNRDPSPSEIEIYAPYLDRQIEIIQPKAIATLGRFSMDYVMRKFGLENELGPISRIHGMMFETKAPYGTVNIIPLFHPAVSVYDRSKFGVLQKDFETLKTII